MRASVVVLAVAIGTSSGHLALAQAPRTDSSQVTSVERQIRDLEALWNEAHVRGDTTTLFRLWAEDLTVIVPGMSPMAKGALAGFWRSGRARIVRYETDSVRIRTWGDTAVVDGLVLRERDFDGRIVSDLWFFTKIYVRRSGEWEITLYQAIPATDRR